MTPERAAAILRELLQTPPQELVHFGRRNGLEGQPSPPDLAQAQELLQAICIALASDPGPNWERVQTAFGAMRARHGELRLDARGPQAPPWIQNVPARPSLGDPAPGTADHRLREAQRDRFVPAAPDRSAPGGAYAPSPTPGPSGYAPPQPHAGYPAPQPHPGHFQPHAGHAAHPGHAAYPGYAPQPGYAAHPGHAAPAPMGQPPAGPSTGYAPAGPFPGQAPATPPRRDDRGIATSVATYAAFCAACAAQPERVAGIMGEYGVHGDEARTQLDEDWQDRFDENPTLHQQWERLFHQFRGQLRR